MAAETTASQRPRRPWWRLVTQFSRRPVLLLVTAASVACWWYLQPKTREEQYGQTPLRLRRQVQYTKWELLSKKPEPRDPFKPAAPQIVMNKEQQLFEIINVGRWQLFDQRG